MSIGFYIAFPIMVVLAILQSTVLPRFPLFGIVPQLWFLFTIAWALHRGLEQGFVWAFIAGVIVDLFSASPMGVTTLALMTSVAAVVFLQRRLPANRIFIPALLAALATIIFWFVYLLLLRIIVPLTIENLQFLGISALANSINSQDLIDDIAGRFSPSGSVLSFILGTTLLNAFLIVPVYWGLYALDRMFRPRRVEI